MTDLEPSRLRDDVDALTEAERSELRGYASEGPSSTIQLRMLAKLTGDVEPMSPAQSSASRLNKVWQLGALCLVLALGSTPFWSKNEVPRPALVQASLPRQPVRATEPAARAGTPESTPAELPTAEKLPSPPHRKQESAVASADPLEELKLLTRARRLLPSRPETSLALTEQHAHLYPHGTLSEEREVLAIEALLKLGRRHEAERRARVFLRLFPNSSQRERLTTSLGLEQEKM